MAASFLVSTLVVAIAEIGDKTQLLSLVLSARYRKPWPIIAGIALATIANHALAAALGTWVKAQVSPDLLRWLLAGSLFVIALWTLKPDTLDDQPTYRGWGVFLVTLVAFFLAEIGDKTQVATIVLAADYGSFALVVMGTTLGMLIANVPVVLAGQSLVARLPMQTIRRIAAGLFAVLGVLVLVLS